MKKLIGLLLLLALPLGCGLVQGDTVSVTLTWTAPGDDGDVGTCSAYDMRWSTDSLNLIGGGQNYDTNWESQLGGRLPMTPQIAGSPESYTVTGLSSKTVYFFAIKAIDSTGNTSPMSNIPQTTTPDGDEPAQITDLRVQ